MKRSRGGGKRIGSVHHYDDLGDEQGLPEAAEDGVGEASGDEDEGDLVEQERQGGVHGVAAEPKPVGGRLLNVEAEHGHRRVRVVVVEVETNGTRHLVWFGRFLYVALTVAS